jgi:hypothetical protein
MTNIIQRNRIVAAVAAFAVLLAVPSWAPAAGTKVSHGGVDLFVPVEPFRGEMSLLEKSGWEALRPDQLPHATDSPPVLASANVVAAIDAGKSTIALYTRQGSRLTRRGEIAFDGGYRFARYKLVRGAKPNRLGAEICSADNRVLLTLYLSADGIFEFQPGEAKNLTFGGARLKYGIVPSLIGTDFIYTAQSAAPGGRPGPEHCYLPSMNLLVGLVGGGDAMMVGVWPPDRQTASLLMKNPGGTRSIDGFSLQTAGSSFYLTFLEKPHIWHAEPLVPDYLETDTVIGWKRPFEAKWIGRFFIASEEIDYPFYFRPERAELWGRPIRGWFYWPVWFDGDETVIHFEKRFPPQGELLIYFLEQHPDRPTGTAILSPVDVMRKALGADEAARLLDLAGLQERPVVSHGLCVCEMTARLQKYFDTGEEVQEQAQIARYAHDVLTFMTSVRRRLIEFRDFAAQSKEFLKARAAAEPKLAGSAGRLLESIEELDGAYRSNVPSATLEEVRQWTDEFNALARQVRPGNAKQFDAVAEKCRSVSGSQDDLVRDLNVLAIRVAEKAAREAVHSPEHAILAQELIARTRQVLRNPTALEPRRHHRLPPDPGRPSEGDLDMPQ